MLRRNVLANVIGGSWAAVLALALIPFQVKILGVAAYGLLAFLASTQVLLSIFDLGLSPTITREVAKDQSPDQRRTRELLRALSVVYWPVGFLLAAAMFGAAGWLAGHWLHLGAISFDRATAAIRYGAIAIGLRWPVSFYSGALAGRQRFGQLNAVKAGVATLTAIVGVAVLLATRDLVAYTAWTALAAAIEVGAYIALLARVVPGLVGAPSLGLLRDRAVWSFAVGIGAINLLSMVLTQSDRILIGKILPIESLGYYALAYNIVLGLSLVQSLVTSAMFPAFVKYSSTRAQEEFRQSYETATRAFMYVYNLAVWLLVFFGYDVLVLVSTRSAADHSWLILALLAIGFLFNAATALSYTASTAAGNTALPIRVNIVGVAGYLPLLYALTIRWGGVGAAAAWLVLNLYYLPTLLRLVHRRILSLATDRWIARSLLPFMVAGVLVFGAAKALAVTVGATGYGALMLALLGCAVYAALGFALLGIELRGQIAESLRGIRAGRVAIWSGRT